VKTGVNVKQIFNLHTAEHDPSIIWTLGNASHGRLPGQVILADGTGFTEDDAPNFTFRQNNCSFYSGSKALGEEVLAGHPDVFTWRLRIPFDHIDSPRNYLTKLMRYSRLLEAANSISHLHEFVGACFACWEKRIPFGIYNVTNPGHVTTREVVGLIRESGVCTKSFEFFTDEAEFFKKSFYLHSKLRELQQEEGRATRANKSGIRTFLTKKKD
jgi:hypothetical protein